MHEKTYGLQWALDRSVEITLSFLLLINGVAAIIYWIPEIAVSMRAPALLPHEVHEAFGEFFAWELSVLKWGLAIVLAIALARALYYRR